MSQAPITGNHTVTEWQQHPTGGKIIGNLLAAFGQDDAVLQQIRNLPLNSLVALSQGRLTQETVTEMILQANGGVMPDLAAATAGTDRFAGTTIIVTGAASGIGRATTERIVREGGRVVAVDVSESGLTELAAMHPQDSILAVVGDITQDADIERIVAAGGARVDGLANVAGIMDGMLPLHETPNEVWDRLMSVNVTGLFKLSRAVLPLMLEQQRGSIVNVASEAALRGNAAGTAYTASKHAVVGITKSAAFLYGPEGVRTNAVAPGPTATAIQGDFTSEFAKRRLGPFFPLIPPVTTADDLAASITWLLSSDSSNVNGVVLASDGGWSVQ